MIRVPLAFSCAGGPSGSRNSLESLETGSSEKTPFPKDPFFLQQFLPLVKSSQPSSGADLMRLSYMVVAVPWPSPFPAIPFGPWQIVYDALS